MEEKTKEKITAKTRELGGDVARIALFSIKLYVVLPLAGLVAGIAGAFLYAHLAESGVWATAGWVLTGLFAGPLLGLFLAWIIATGLVDDFIFKTGWDATKTGYRQIKKVFGKKA